MRFLNLKNSTSPRFMMTSLSWVEIIRWMRMKPLRALSIPLFQSTNLKEKWEICQRATTAVVVVLVEPLKMIKPKTSTRQRKSPKKDRKRKNIISMKVEGSLTQKIFSRPSRSLLSTISEATCHT